MLSPFMLVKLLPIYNGGCIIGSQMVVGGSIPDELGVAQAVLYHISGGLGGTCGTGVMVGTKGPGTASDDWEPLCIMEGAISGTRVGDRGVQGVTKAGKGHM